MQEPQTPPVALVRSVVAARRVSALAGGAIVAAFLIGGFPSPVQGADRLTLAAAANTADVAVSEAVLTVAYARIGVALGVARYPAERAIKTADSGAADGDVQRIDGLAKVYPNLIQVRPPINFIEGAIFVTTASFAVAGWESLRPYRIGIIHGIKFAENNTRGMNVEAAGDYDGLFRMLAAGRVDVAVSPRLNGILHLRRIGTPGIRDLPTALQRFELFHYLHRRHQGLAARIGAVLEEMRRAGELAKIKEVVVAALLAAPGACVELRCLGIETRLPK